MPTYDKKENKRLLNLFAALNTPNRHSKAGKDLQNRIEEFSSVFEFAVIGMGLSTLDGYWIKANQALCDMLGYSEDELLALRFQDVTHPGDFDADAENVRKLVNGEIKALQTEKRYIHKSGSIVWISLNAKIIFDANNNPLYFFSQIKDITNRKKAEEEIFKERERMANIIEGTNVGTWEWNIQTGELLFNKRLAEIIGYTLEEITPIDVSGWENFVHPEDLRRADGMLKKIFAKKMDQLDIENRLKHKDGSWVWVHDRGKVVSWAPDGKPLWMSGMYIDISERKKAEDALVHSHNLLRYIIEHNRSSVAVHDRDLKYIYVSQRYLEEYNVTDKDIIGKHHYDVFPDLPMKWREVHSKALAGEVLSAEDDPYVRKDGTIEWTRWECRPWYEADGSIGGIIVYTEVITDRKKIEESLRLSYQHSHNLIETSLDPLVTISPKGVITEVNTATEKITGVSREKLIGSDFTSYFTEPQKARAGYLKAFELGEVINYPLAMRHLSGSITDVLYNVSVYRNEQGEVLGVFAAARDITESKKAEKALMLSESRFKTMFNEAPLGIALIDSLTGHIYSANPMYAKIAGRTMDEMIHIDWMSLTHPDDIQKDLANMALLNAGKISGFQMEKRYIHKDGSLVWISMTVASIFTEDRAHPRHLAMIEDITQRKKTEKEILHLSFHDHLTGLYNRRFFEEELKRLDTVRQLPLSFVMGDLNSLKIINDVFGHNKGDELLKEVAEIMQSVCRSDDILARWGGDEFVILLPRTSAADTEDIVERIKNECGKTNSRKIPASLSLGAATKEKVSQDIQSIVIDAENNMYKNKLAQKESLTSSIIFALEQALYEKSSETKEHTDRMHDFALRLGKSVRLSSHQLDDLSLLASLHDIGKVAIPEKILLKKGKLTEKEWSVVKRHPEIGSNIARSSPQIAHIAKSILSCHENFDGSGYPLGIKEDAIPVISRIILIVDAYDVMTSGRAYKPAMSKEDAIKELKRCAGTQFDPGLAGKFIEILEK